MRQRLLRATRCRRGSGLTATGTRDGLEQRQIGERVAVERGLFQREAEAFGELAGARELALAVAEGVDEAPREPAIARHFEVARDDVGDAEAARERVRDVGSRAGHDGEDVALHAVLVHGPATVLAHQRLDVAEEPVVAASLHDRLLGPREPERRPPRDRLRVDDAERVLRHPPRDPRRVLPRRPAARTHVLDVERRRLLADERAVEVEERGRHQAVLSTRRSPSPGSWSTRCRACGRSRPLRCRRCARAAIRTPEPGRRRRGAWRSGR